MSSQRPGTRVSRRWWEQENLDLEGAKKKAAAAAAAELDREEIIGKGEVIPPAITTSRE